MKVILYPAVTLDGFIANEKGECYQWISDEDEANYEALMAQAGCAIVGRKTFDQYRDEYPFEGDIKTFVYSREPKESDDPKIQYVSGDPREVLELLKGQGFSEVIISGGGEINGLFASAGLVDEIIISMYSLTLGAGIPLFGSHKPNLALKLLSSKNEIKGVVTNHYKVQDS